MFGRTAFYKVLVALLGALLGVVGLPALPAVAAHQYLWWNEAGESFATFGANAQVTIYQGSIEVECDAFRPTADIYVVRAGSASQGSTLVDVSGSPNTVLAAGGGLFVDEPIGFTSPGGSIGPGRYAVVYDECQNQKVDPVDKVFDPAFEVVAAPGIPPLPPPSIAQLKANAGAQKESWITARVMLAILYALDMYNTLRPGTKNLLDAFKAVSKDTASNLTKADPFMAALDGLIDLAGHYRGIEADPPDANFAQVTLAGPWAVAEPTSASDVRAAVSSLLETARAESGLAEALLHSLERYQGAAAASDRSWALTHARAVRDYASTLSAQLLSTGVALTDVEAALVADVRPLDDEAVLYEQLRSRVASSGFTAEEEREAGHLGLDAGDLSEMRAQLLAQSFDYREDDLRAVLGHLRNRGQDLARTLDALAGEMSVVVDTIKGDPSTIDDRPDASAGGPYTGREGTPMTFDASGSVSASPINSIAWDLDGDGTFGDATESMPTYTYARPLRGRVGVKVTNATGRFDVAYTSVTVADVNRRPSARLSEPLDEAREHLVGETRTYRLGVSDPDYDAVSTTWHLDGRVAAVGDAFTYTPTSAELGQRMLRAVVNDSSPLSGATELPVVVSVLMPDADGDGWRADLDCADSDPAVNPGRDEVIGNEKDDDCDSATPDTGGAQRPVATDDAYVVDQDGVLNVPAAGVLSNDVGPSGAGLEAVVATPPSSGTLTLSSSGGFVYAPRSGFSGTDAFTYKARAGSLESAPGRVSITVKRPGDRCTTSTWEGFGSAANLTMNGASKVVAGVLRVAPSAPNQAGSAFTTAKVSLADAGSFSTYFRFRFSNQVNTGADGLVFVVQNVANNVGGLGGGIGYGGLMPSVAVEFDNWHNWEGSDPSASHIGINQNGSMVSSPVLDLPYDLDNGLMKYAWVDYNGATDRLEVRLAETDVRPEEPLLVKSVDLPAILGAMEAFVGFTSGTGLASADHDVTFWQLVNCYAPIGVKPSPENRAPIATDDGYEIDEGGTLRVAAAGLVANDDDPDGDELSVTNVAPTATGTTHGTVSLDHGWVTYVPEPDYHGPSQFTYTVSDGNGGVDSGTVSVMVRSVADAPVAQDDAYTTDEDTQLTVGAPGVLANDTDRDGDVLAAALVTSPSHGTVTLNANGSFVYQPTAAFNGTDSFTYRTRDGSGTSIAATVTITVRAVNDPPNCSNVRGDLRTLWPPNHRLRLVTLSGATDGDGDAVTITVGAVTQDEPVNGLGDGDTAPDAVLGAGPSQVSLRAERSGTGDGRVYAVAYSVTDTAGSRCAGVFTVGVPHDQGAGATAVDSGQTVSSFGR